METAQNRATVTVSSGRQNVLVAPGNLGGDVRIRDWFTPHVMRFEERHQYSEISRLRECGGDVATHRNLCESLLKTSNEAVEKVSFEKFEP